MTLLIVVSVLTGVVAVGVFVGLVGSGRLREARASWDAVTLPEIHYDDADGKRMALPTARLSDDTLRYLLLNRNGVILK